MAQINEYAVTAISIENGSFFDVDQEISPGVFQSQKVPKSVMLALIKTIFNSDGLLDGDRIIDGDGNSISFIGLSDFITSCQSMGLNVQDQFNLTVVDGEMSLNVTQGNAELIVSSGEILLDSSDDFVVNSGKRIRFTSNEGILIPVATTLERDLIPLPDIGLKIYNLDSDREEYFHPSDGWIPTGRYGGQASTNGQVQYASNSTEEIQGGNLRVSGTQTLPINETTGAFSNYINDLGQNGGAFRFVYGRGYRAISSLGANDGYQFTSNGGIKHSIGTGGGLLFKSASSKQLMKVYGSGSRGVVVSNSDLTDAYQGDDGLSLEVVGDGVMKLKPTTDVIMQTKSANWSDGWMCIISSTGTGPTFTSAGLWRYDGSAWVFVG